MNSGNSYCVKGVRIRSFSGPYFSAFGLNTERYEVSLCIQSKCGKIRTRKTLNTVTFYAISLENQLNKSEETSKNFYNCQLSTVAKIF